VPAEISGLSDKEIKVCELISSNSKITAADMSESLGLTRRQIEFILASLKDRDIIKRIGSKKSGRWVLNSKK
jgi:predicted HTH transcriptional regulator